MSDERIDDGGPAFPHVFEDRTVKGVVNTTVVSGLSKRDLLAGMAVQGLCADYGRTTCAADGVHENLAMIAYRIADAMLIARKVHEQKDESK